MMKNSAMVFLTLIGIVMLARPAAATAPCKESSFSPEAHTFYGDAQAVIDKVKDANLQVADRRMYLLSVETEGKAELFLFERDHHNDSNIAVATWTGTSDGGLNDKVSDLMLKNRGLACIGEQAKALVSKAVKLNQKGSIPAPATALAAFSHPIRGYGDKYIRVTVILLC